MKYTSGDMTDKYIGVKEALLMIGIGGMLFSIFSGQPVVIVGVTGSILIFEDALYQVNCYLSHFQ